MTSNRSRWQRSPPPGTPFNAGDETKFVAHWARGIASADALQRSEIVPVGAPTIAVGANSPALQTVNASSQYAYVARSLVGASLVGEQPYTLATYFVPANTTTRGTLISVGNTGTDTPYLWLELNATAGKASFNTRPDSGGGEILATANTTTAGQRSTAVAVSYGAASRKVVLNGDIGNAASGSTNYAGLTFALNRTGIGALTRVGAIVFFEGKHVLQIIELRAWSDLEIIEFHRHPFARFRERMTMLPMYLPTASAFKPAWAKGINTVISAGARTA